MSRLIGQDELVQTVRNQYKSKREPSGWLFVGPTGTGKTTVARILALSLQCTHGDFGEPCEVCLEKRNDFAIQEINASEVNGVEDIQKIAASSVYTPMGSRRLVIILDEAQRLSPAAQNLLLKYIEDAPQSTVWIICTTEENKLLKTILRRGQRAQLRLLQANSVAKLVRRAFKYVGDKRDPAKLIDALWEARVQSPGFILNAVESFLSGMSEKEAVKSIGQFADVIAICRSLEKGDWDAIRKETAEAENDDLRSIRAQVAGYLRRCLEKAIPGPRAGEFSKAIKGLAQVDSYTDATQGAATVAALYDLCQLFAGPKEERDDDD